MADKLTLSALIFVALLIGSPLSVAAIPSSTSNAPEGEVTPTASIQLAQSNVTDLQNAQLVFNQDGLHVLEADGTVTSLGVNATVVGPIADLDNDGSNELPYVSEYGTIWAIDGSGESTALATGAATSRTTLAVGDWDGNGKLGVLYVNGSDNSYLYRAEFGRSPQKVLDLSTTAIVGTGDFNGDGDGDVLAIDGTDELVFLDDASVQGTGYTVTSANGSLAVGAPADFDGGGVVRVPVVDASGELALVNSTGTVSAVTTSYGNASIGPIAGADWAGDGGGEILHVDTNGVLSYTFLNGTTQHVLDDSGQQVQADTALGVTGLAATELGTASGSVGWNGSLLTLSNDTVNVPSTNHTIQYHVDEGSDLAGSTLDSLDIWYPNASFDADGVNASTVSSAGVDQDGDGTLDVTENVTDDDLNVTDGGNTVSMDFDGNHTLAEGDVISVEYENVSSPTAADDYQVIAGVNDAVGKAESVSVAPSNQTNTGGIESVELVDKTDLDGDGYYSSFDLRIVADTHFEDDEGGIGEPYYDVFFDGRRVRVADVDATNNSDVTISISPVSLDGPTGTKTVQVELRDADTYENNGKYDSDYVDERSKTVTYESIGAESVDGDVNMTVIRNSTNIYQTMDEKALNTTYWDQYAENRSKDVAYLIRNEMEYEMEWVSLGLASVGNETLDEQKREVKNKLGVRTIKEGIKVLADAGPVGSKLLKNILRIEFFAHLSTTLTGTAQSSSLLAHGYSVSEHLDSPGYNDQNYTKLHGNLQELEANTEQLETARDNGNVTRETQLLEERKQLLNETYTLVSVYAEETHESVVQNAVGSEDLGAYGTIRGQLDTLRTTLHIDYIATNDALEAQPEALTDERDMPVTGWTVEYSTKDALWGSTAGIWNSRSRSSESFTEVMGRTLANLAPGPSIFPATDRYGKATVYDSMDTYDDYTVYRIALDPDIAPEDGRTLHVQIGRTSAKQTTGARGSFEAVLTADEPRNISELDPVETFKKVDDSTLTSQKLTLENADEDDYYLVVKSNLSIGPYKIHARTNRPGTTGRDGGVDIEAVGREGPDIQRPVLELASGPEPVPLRSGEIVHVSESERVTLQWHAWDLKTASEDLVFKYRIAGPDGSSNWSTWTNLSSNGNIFQDLNLEEGYHDVQVVVRDEVGYRTQRTTTIKVDKTAPTLELTSANGTGSALVYTWVDERIRYVEYEYRRLNGSDEWTDWQRINNTDELGPLPFGKVGTFEMRARAVDLACRSSDWQTTVFSNEGMITVYKEPSEEDDGIEVIEGPYDNGTVGNGTNISISPPAANGTNGTGSFVGNATVSLDNIDGDFVMIIYETLRNGARIKLDTIELVPDQPITLSELIPPQLRANTEIILEFYGDGTARLVDIKLTEVSPIDIDITPMEPEVDETVTFTAEKKDWYGGDVQSYEWDFDGDGTIDAIGQTVTYAFGTNGLHTVHLTANTTNDGMVTATKTVAVDAVPNATVTGTTQAKTFEETTVRIEAASDSDGAITTYEWDVDDDGIYEETGPIVHPIFETPGDHVVTVRVSDSSGSTITATHVIHVENRLPVPVVSPDTVPANVSATLSGADSTDRDGEIVSYEWDLDGDGTCEKSGMNVAHTFNSSGTAQVSLRVTDDYSGVNTTNLTLTVTEPPSVTIEGPTTVSVNASDTWVTNASDSDGSIVSYEWDFDDGTTATGSNVTYAYGTAGNYTLSVTVTDDDGVTATDTLDVEVVANPQVTIEGPTTVLRNNAANFTANVTAAGANVTSYDWMFGDGANGTGQNVAHAYDSTGTYTVSVTVTDAVSGTGTDVHSVEVDAKPSVIIDGPTALEEGESATFTANASDADGSVVSYDWTFGDGTNATGSDVTQTYDAPGNYTVSVTVTDDEGYMASADLAVTVDADNAPTANATANVTTVLVGESVRLDGSNSTDPDDETLNYTWDFGDGTNTSGVNVTHAFNQSGTYNVTLTVDDGNTTDTDVVAIIVTNEGPVAHWRFDDGNGTIATDSVGSNDATFNGATWTSDAEVGTHALDFEPGDNAEVPHDNALAPGHITVATWVKVETVQHADRILSKDAGNNGYQLYISHSETDQEFGGMVEVGGSTYWLSGNQTYSSDRWHHVTMTYDGETANFYMDGVLVDRETAPSGPLSDTSGPLYIAERGDGKHIDARIDDLRIYNRVLPQSEVQQLYDSTSNDAPTANATVNATSVQVNETIAFSGANSTDPDGDALNYTWAFDDGTNATDVNVTHAFNESGTYNVTLTVDDGEYNDTDTVTITVEESALQQGLVSHWKFDGDATDSASENDGTIVNGPSFVDGVSGSAISLDGVDDSVSLPDSMPTDVPMDGTANFTISFWLNNHRVASSDDVDYTTVFRQNSWLQHVPVPGGGSYKWGVYDGDAGAWREVTGPAVETNSWRLVTLVFESGGDMVYYVNGTEVNRISAGITTIGDKGQSNRLSRATWDNKGYLDGELDDLRIYSRSLSTFEVQQLYNQTVA